MMSRQAYYKKKLRLEAMSAEIIKLKLNVFPETPFEERSQLRHKIALLCDSYNTLKSELKIK